MPMSKIIFYDIPSRLPTKAWSPNTWKTRYCLNFKGLSYRTEWVEYPDIETHCRRLDIPPTTKKPDGTAGYTLPAIHDPSTGANVSNSFNIAEYLDRTYSHLPFIFPHNTAGVQNPFARAFASNMGPIFNFLIPPECQILNLISAEYFRQTREKTYGKRLEDMVPAGENRVEEWAKVRRGLESTGSWFAKNDGNGPFIMGKEPCWADFVVGGYMKWIRAVFGENSQEWNDIASWDHSRWKLFVDGLKKYEEIK